MSEYDWNGEANRKVGERAPRVPNGEHELVIATVYRDDRDGRPLESQNGDPQLSLVIEDLDGRRCYDRLTLSRRAGFRAAQYLQAGGRDLTSLAGHGPEVFSDINLARDWFEGLAFIGRVQWKRSRNNRAYSEVTPLRPAPDAGSFVGDGEPETPAAEPHVEYDAEAEDEIPF